MRLMPLVTAIVVAAFMYFFILERDALLSLARTEVDPAASQQVGEQAAEQINDASGTRPSSAVAVVAMQSQAQEIDSVVVLRGRTEAARQVEVRAETSGQVISEPLDRGAFVDAQEALCVLDPGTRAANLSEAQARLEEARGRVPEAQATLAEAEARVREAQINLTAARSLSEGGFASETRLVGAEASLEGSLAGVERARAGVIAARAGIQSGEAAVATAQKEMERLTIRAPFAGVLETGTAELGALLQPGAACATVIQLDPIRLVGFVPEIDVGKISVGAPAGARLTSRRQVQGQVTFLSRAGDETTRTFRVEVQVANDDLAIRDGETAEILVQAEGRMAHLLPQSALTLDDEGALGVRTVDAQSRAAFAEVDLLRDTVEGVWVAGLPETLDVIVVGQEYVTEGVTVAPTMRANLVGVQE